MLDTTLREAIRQAEEPGVTKLILHTGVGRPRAAVIVVALDPTSNQQLLAAYAKAEKEWDDEPDLVSVTVDDIEDSWETLDDMLAPEAHFLSSLQRPDGPQETILTYQSPRRP